MTLLQQGNEQSAGAQPSETRAVSGFVMQIHGGQHDGRLIRVLGQKCTIGRASHCTIQLASPEFQPLHCLLVRGQGGIVVRCWSQHTTLNGKEFSVSWMVPGDRLGIGSIELELLRPAAVDGVPADERRQPKSQAQPLASDLHAAPQRCHNDVSQAVELNHELTDVKDELARAQEFLAQLLEERQELLERLAVLQSEVDGFQATPETADSRLMPVADWEAERRELQDAHDRQTQQLQSELQQAVTQRDSLHAIVVELREEVGAVVQLRERWYQERDQLQRRLDLEMLDRSALGERIEPPGDLAVSPQWLPTESSQPTASSSALLGDQPAVVDAMGYQREPSSEQAETLDDLCRGEIADTDGAAQDRCRSGVDSVHDDLPTGDGDDVYYGVTDRRGGQYDGRLVGLEPLGDAETPAPIVEKCPIELPTRRTTSPQINLEAMRDVANQSARVAIDRAAHRRGLQRAAYKWLLAICAIIIGGAVTVIIKDNVVLGRVLSGLCWTISVWWLFLGSASYRSAVLTHRQRKERSPKSSPRRDAWGEPQDVSSGSGGIVMRPESTAQGSSDANDTAQ